MCIVKKIYISEFDKIKDLCALHVFMVMKNESSDNTLHSTALICVINSPGLVIISTTTNQDIRGSIHKTFTLVFILVH